jgi:hypothetical protein
VEIEKEMSSTVIQGIIALSVIFAAYGVIIYFLWKEGKAAYE